MKRKLSFNHRVFWIHCTGFRKFKAHQKSIYQSHIMIISLTWGLKCSSRDHQAFHHLPCCLTPRSTRCCSSGVEEAEQVPSRKNEPLTFFNQRKICQSHIFPTVASQPRGRVREEKKITFSFSRLMLAWSSPSSPLEYYVSLLNGPQRRNKFVMSSTFLGCSSSLKHVLFRAFHLCISCNVFSLICCSPL